ncbi:MAG: Crp/Fnr family transcriptional regulator [Limisphaerales bacterium]
MKTLDSIVTSHPFVNTMRPEHLELLCKNAKEVEFAEGDLLFRQGDPANRMYLIQSGKVALEAHEQGKTVPLQVLGTNDVLGWSWLFPPFSWNFQARATEPTRVIALDGGHLLVTCEENHDFGYELMKRVAQMVIHRLQTTRQQLLQRK